jgi:hypothetical protein
MDRSSAQSQVKLSLPRSNSLKFQPQTTQYTICCVSSALHPTLLKLHRPSFCVGKKSEIFCHYSILYMLLLKGQSVTSCFLTFKLLPRTKLQSSFCCSYQAFFAVQNIFTINMPNYWLAYSQYCMAMVSFIKIHTH